LSVHMLKSFFFFALHFRIFFYREMFLFICQSSIYLKSYVKCQWTVFKYVGL
jgi:hypothetical protein